MLYAGAHADADAAAGPLVGHRRRRADAADACRCCLREDPAGSFLPGSALCCAAPSPPSTSPSEYLFRQCPDLKASHSQLGTGPAATAGAWPGGSRGGPAHSVHCMWGCLVRETERFNKRLTEPTWIVCAAGRASLGLASPRHHIASHHITAHCTLALPAPSSAQRPRDPLFASAARCATVGSSCARRAGMTSRRCA
jgi:hypothetical protein